MMELVTKSFAEQALAFPDRVAAALASVETVDDAKQLLDKASVMRVYAEKLKAGVENERPITYGLSLTPRFGSLWLNVFLLRRKAGHLRLDAWPQFSNSLAFDVFVAGTTSGAPRVP